MHSILYKLSNPVMSFPVEWKGGALGFTLSSLVAGPNMRLMTVCGSLGALTVDPRTGKTGKLISQVGRKRGLVRLASEQLRLRARNARGRDAISVVNAAAEEFVTSILMEGWGVHSVASNARSGHIFVPVNGKGICVIMPER